MSGFLHQLATIIGSLVLGMGLIGAGAVVYAMYHYIIFGRRAEFEESFWRAWEHYRQWRDLERLKRKASQRYYVSR